MIRPKFLQRKTRREIILSEINWLTNQMKILDQKIKIRKRELNSIKRL